MANSPYLQSAQNSRYGSPASSQWGGEMYHGQPAQMMPYGPYTSPIPVHAQPHAYGSPPYSHLSRGVSTPPTSSHSQDDGTTPRKARARATKRKNKSAADKPNIPVLEKPLSELTKDMEVPIRDMEAWVHRSAEDRQAEAEKRNGQIARPMNSFMLYRSAYAERTKMWCTQNNHQIVSAVSGKSWPLETQEIRDHYNDLSKLERDNHQKAFPGYKFSPSKTNAAGQRKRKDGDDKEDGSVLTEEDGDGDYRPGHGPRRRARGSNRSATPDLNYGGYPGFTSAPGPMPYRIQGNRDHSLNMSHFNASNPGQMAPEPLGQVYDQYYEMQQYPTAGLHHPGVHDVQYIQHPHPMMPQQHHSIVGLPGGAHQELLDDQSWNGGSMPDNGHIDPMLMPEYDASFLGQGQLEHAGAFSERGFRDLEGDLAVAAYGPGTAGSGHGGLSGFPEVKTSEDEQEEFDRIMNGKSA